MYAAQSFFPFQQTISVDQLSRNDILDLNGVHHFPDNIPDILLSDTFLHGINGCNRIDL